jgi:hypothetical protein
MNLAYPGNCEGLKRLAALLLLRRDELSRRWVMIFRAGNGFFDETGTDAKSRIVAVGGWLGSFESLIKTEVKWKAALPAEAKGDFHYADFWARKSYGADWSDADRLRFVQKLARIACNGTSMGVGAAVVKDEYWRVIKDLNHATSADNDMLRALREDPFYYCLAQCFSLLLHWKLPADIKKPLAFVYGESPRPGYVVDAFERVKGWFDRDDLFGGVWPYGKRKEEPILQAADLLVGELRRHIEGHPSEVIPILRAKDSLLFTAPQEKALRERAERLLRDFSLTKK